MGRLRPSGGYREQLATARLAERRRRKADRTDPTDPSDHIPACPECGRLIAYGQGRQECRQTVLGLPGVSGVQRRCQVVTPVACRMKGFSAEGDCGHHLDQRWNARVNRCSYWARRASAGIASISSVTGYRRVPA